MKQNNALTFETEYNKELNWTHVIAKINDKNCAYVSSYSGEPDEWRNEDELMAFKDRILYFYDVFYYLKKADSAINYYKNEANDELRDDICIISLHLINHVVEFLKQKFQYNDDIAEILQMEYLNQNKVKRFDLILDNWKALTIEQMQKTNPIAFAKSTYEFEELNEDEIKELLYEMYNVYVTKSEQ